MANKQGTVIYIEQGEERNDLLEAEYMSRSFVNKEIHDRAYINALGADLVTKYLETEGVNVENLHNIHSMSKILEDVDVSDILLPNIHLDVRVVYNEEQIFVPKSHFDLGITPDAYVVLKLDKEFKQAELLGYFKPSQINKSKENDDYYFFSPSKMYKVETFTRFVKEHVGKNVRKISEEDMLRGRELSVAMADHSITMSEERELLELLLQNDSLRESVLEFDNFETLAYSVAPTFVERFSNNVEAKDENNIPLVANIEEPAEISLSEMSMDEELDFDSLDEPDLLSEEDLGSEENEEQQEESKDEEDNQDSENEATHNEVSLEDLFAEDTVDIDVNEPEIERKEVSEVFEEAEVENMDIPETLSGMVIDAEAGMGGFEVLSDEDEIKEDVVEDNIETEAPSLETIEEPVQEETEKVEEAVEQQVEEKLEDEPAPLLEEETPILDMEETTDLGDDLLGEDFMDLKDLPKEEFPVEKPVEETKAEELVDTVEAVEAEPVVDISSESQPVVDEIVVPDEIQTLDETELPKATEELSVDSILDETIASIGAEPETQPQPEEHIAALDGELINNVVSENIERQQKNLDRIDYEKTDIAPDVTEIPEHIAVGEELSVTKMEANLEAENSGEFGGPTNLEDLDSVETFEEEEFIPETIDLEGMDVVNEGQNFDDTLDENISDLDSFATLGDSNKNNEPLPEMNLEEDAGMDLPMFGSYSINDDGTSALDAFDVPVVPQNEDENLVDMGITSNLNGFGDDSGLKLKEEDDEKPYRNTDYEESNTISSEVYGDKIISNSDSSMFDESVEFSEQYKMDDLESEDFMNELTSTLDEKQPKEEDNSSTKEFDENDLSIFEDTEESSDSLDNLDVHEDSLDVVEEISEPQEIQEEVSEIVEDVQNDELLDDLEFDNTELDDNFENPTEENDEIKLVEDVEEEPVDSPVELDDEIDNLELDQPEAPQVEDVIGDLQEAPQVEEEKSQQEDWMGDNDYNELEDVEVQPSIQNDEVEITEPTEAPKEFDAYENSTVISDKTFKTGEIMIDINQSQQPMVEENSSLESLYDTGSKMPGGSLLENPGTLGAARPNNGLALGVVFAVLVTGLALFAALGFGVFKLIKAPTEEAPQPITDEPLSTDSNGVEETNTLNVDPNNVVNMDANTDALATTNTVAPAAKSKKPLATSAPKTITAQTPKRVGAGVPFVDVKKLSWEVPDYISYNNSFKQYLQSVGKSLKLSMESDLLLATDNLYSNLARVSITFDKNGTFQDAQVITSTGSAQIDKIVLQTVNHTLKLLKAPSGVVKDENTTVVLKIYF